MDMRTGIAAYGTIEMMLKEVMLAQLSDYYQIPSWGTGGCTDSKVLDEQAIAEAVMNLTISALSGNNLVHDVAFMEFANSGSFELLVICDEIIAMLKRFMRGVKVDNETLAVEIIKEAGHGGDFLHLDHTLKYFKEEFMIPELMDRSPWSRWEKEKKTLAKRAHEKVIKILKEHSVEPIPKVIKEEIEKLIYKVEGRVIKT
ncbi:hypothetical protein HRbin06_00677 [archaeon HR06]|nr:hypothetical protein HRbin06_00677 [archaeon HR06]